MYTESVVLLCLTEVIHMKYENPTCEIVVLDSADCLTASGGVTNVRDNDTPFVDYPTF